MACLSAQITREPPIQSWILEGSADDGEPVGTVVPDVAWWPKNGETVESREQPPPKRFARPLLHSIVAECIALHTDRTNLSHVPWIQSPANVGVVDLFLHRSTFLRLSVFTAATRARRSRGFSALAIAAIATSLLVLTLCCLVCAVRIRNRRSRATAPFLAVRPPSGTPMSPPQYQRVVLY